MKDFFLCYSVVQITDNIVSITQLWAITQCRSNHLRNIIEIGLAIYIFNQFYNKFWFPQITPHLLLSLIVRWYSLQPCLTTFWPRGPHGLHNVEETMMQQNLPLYHIEYATKVMIKKSRIWILLAARQTILNNECGEQPLLHPVIDISFGLFFARFDDTGRYRFCVYGWRRFGVDTDFGLLRCCARYSRILLLEENMQPK